MGHLETAVRTLAMLARGGGCCSTFEERLDVLMQGYYFVGRMAGMVEETVECGRRRWLFEESVPEGGERGETAFQEWCASSSGGYNNGRNIVVVVILFTAFHIYLIYVLFKPREWRFWAKIIPAMSNAGSDLPVPFLSDTRARDPVTMSRVRRGACSKRR